MGKNGVKKSLVLFFYLVSVIGAFGQSLKAEEVIAERSIGKTNGFRVFVPKSDEKMLENGFKSWMKDYKAKVEKDRNSKETYALAVNIPSLGTSAFDIYTSYEETDEGGFITTYIKLGDVYLTGNTHRKETEEWKRLLSKFANEQAAEIVQKELDSEEKTLQNTGKDYEKLKKDKTDYEKDIADCEAKIKERKSQLEKNATDQVNIQATLKQQEEIVEKKKLELKRYVD